MLTSDRATVVGDNLTGAGIRRAETGAALAPLSFASPSTSRIAAPAPSVKIEQFRYMAAIGIILVVFLHSGGQPRATPTPAFLWLPFLHFNSALSIMRMPLFFFMSGFLFLYTNPAGRQLNYPRLVQRKIVRLLVPFVAMNTLAFPIKAAFTSHALRPVALNLSTYLRSLIDPQLTPIGFYWFLMALFGMFLVAPALRALIHLNKAPLIVLVSGCLLAMRWSADVLPSLLGAYSIAAHLFYFWMGMVACHYRSRLVLPMSSRPVVAAAGAAAVFLYYAFLSDVICIRFIVVLWSFYTTYYIADVYLRKGWRFLEPFATSTYQIYLLAWFPQQFAVVVLYKMMGCGYWTCVAVMFLGGLLLPILAHRLIQRFAPVLAPLIGVPAVALPRSSNPRDAGDLVARHPSSTAVTTVSSM